MLVTASSARSLQAKLGLPLVNQVAGWVILGLSAFFIAKRFLIHPVLVVTATLLPLVLRRMQLDADTRTHTLLLGLSVCFVVLSISVESLFFLVYTLTLSMWTHVEAALKASRSTLSGTIEKAKMKGETADEHLLTADDVRIAVFFLFFVQVAFFGTGK